MMELSNDELAVDVPNGLFKDIKYYLLGKVPKSTENLLNAGGAKKDMYLTEKLTHCIADDDNDGVTEAKEIFQLPVVTSSWVLMSVKCGTLLPTSIFDPETKRNIFKGVVICPSQLSAKDSKVIWALITCCGGQYQTKLNKNVTHLVSTSVKSLKYNIAQPHSDVTKTVTPDWVTECAKQKCLLDELSYHPRLLVDEPIRPSSLPDVVDEKQGASFVPSILPPSTPTSIRNETTISTKSSVSRIVSNRQMAQQVSALRIKESIIGVNKEEVEPFTPTPPPPPPPRPTVRPATIRPCLPLAIPQPLPTTPRSLTPRQMLRNIANSSSTETKTPKNSSKANSAKISQLVSSMTQMPLRQVSPSRSTMNMYPMMSSVGKSHIQNEVKIYYGHDPGEHVPDDACLLGCVFYITDYQKYLELSTLDTWKQVINQFGGQVDDSYSNRITHVLCEHQKSDVFRLALRDGKRLVTAHWLNDCLLLKKMKSPWMALHIPYIFGKEKPCANQIVCVTNFVDEERDKVKHMINLLGANYTGYMSCANSVLIAKKPGGRKYERAIEWQIPVVNVQWLNDIILGDLNALKLPLQSRYMPSILDNEFNIDVNRVAHLLDGWKVPVKISKETWKKFQSSQNMKSQLTAFVGQNNQIIHDNMTLYSSPLKHRSESDYEISPEKRARLTSPSFSEMDVVSFRGPIVLITGIPRNRSILLAHEVERLGGKMALSASFCSHLVTVAILRTVKFLTALGHVQYIVSPEWIEHSSRANRFLDEACFALHDDNTEAAFNFKLYESLRRSKEKKVFQEMYFYLTPDVAPNRSLLAEMIMSSGGKVVETLPSINSILQHVHVKGRPTFIIISCDKDMYLCQKLVQRNIDIHNSEFVLTGIMRQEVDYLTHRL